MDMYNGPEGSIEFWYEYDTELEYYIATKNDGTIEINFMKYEDALNWLRS